MFIGQTMAIMSVAIALLAIPVDALASGFDVKLDRARSLVDEYHGQRAKLDEAARLVGEVLAADPRSVEGLVQGARIAIKGGHIVSGRYRPGSLDLYEELIDRALAVSPNHVPAIGLKAEVLLLRRDLTKALSTIQRGLALDPSYPWLRLTLGEYHLESREVGKALQQYRLVVDKGPQPQDRNQRRAYVAALLRMVSVYAAPANAQLVRDLAAKVDAARHPEDAWTLGDIAGHFVEMGLFDDAMAYARKALSVMNYGVARRNLAFALYGKAAQLDKTGGDFAALAREAAALEVDPDGVLEWFQQGEVHLSALAPHVERVLRHTRRTSPRRSSGS
jgi:tetratricopeptide (TPR) repeat protein